MLDGLPLGSIIEKEAREKALSETLEFIGLKPDAKTQRVRAFRNLFIAGWNAAIDYRTNGNIQQHVPPDNQ